MNEHAISLLALRSGDKGVVIALQGGHSFQERATSMGLFVGCEVVVLGGGNGSRMLLAVGDTRIALGHGMADKVLVAVDPV
jgi:ferrous iron transport protein A